MAGTSAPGVGNAASTNRRLESWGEVAAYLRREIRTVQRWERNLGLPVHRLSVGRNASVFAYTAELDEWFRKRESLLKDDKEEEVPQVPRGQSTHVSEGQQTTPPVERDSAGAGAARPMTTAPGAHAAALAAPEEEHKKTERWIRPRRSYTWVAAIGVMLAAAFLISRFAFLLPSVSFQPRSLAPEKMRLFVRPFKTISGDAEFTEGLTDEINPELGKIDSERLGVIAPTTAKQFALKPIDELDSLLKVQYVLEGSVRRANDKVQIDLSLISARDQTSLFADSFTENVADVLKVQQEVAAAVGQRLLRSLPQAKQPVSPATVDPQGYLSYLRGRRFWAERDLAHSVPAFEDATAKLPRIALAHSGLAASYAIMGEAPNDAMAATLSAPQAKAEAQRALALDSTNAEAHYVLGNLAMSFDLDFRTAERELRQAITLEPNNPTAHQWLGQYLMTQNRLPEAQAETLKALDLDPVSPIFTTTRAEAFYYARDFDATVAQASLTLEHTPHFLLGEYWLASAYREKKMYPEALQHFRAASALAPGNPALLMALGHALAVSRDQNGARAVLAQLQTIAHQRYVPAIYFAGLYVGLGDKDSAFRYLDKAVAEHDDRLIYLAVEPIADPLRSDPRFEALLARIHLH